MEESPIWYNQRDDTERLLAHVSTDKPFYKQGELVFIEVYVVDALTKKPKIYEVKVDPPVVDPEPILLVEDVARPKIIAPMPPIAMPPG